MFLTILVTAFVSLFVGIVILGHVLLIMAAFHGKKGLAVRRDRPVDTLSRETHDLAAKFAGAKR